VSNEIIKAELQFSVVSRDFTRSHIVKSRFFIYQLFELKTGNLATA